MVLDFIDRFYYNHRNLYVVVTTKGCIMDFNFLSATPLFLGMADTEIQSVLSCLGYRERLYKKGEIIFHAGSTVHEIGLVESGSVNVIVNFYWGQSNIFGHIGKGAVFAEHYAAIPDTELLCDIVASEASEILFLDIDKIMSTCRNECVFHKRLIQNLLKISAQKSLALSARMIHIAPKSLRARIQSYLSEQALLSGSPRFSIPFDRQQLADYLGVDRSALSGELSRMKRDGLISFRKNEFTLHDGFSDA